jgi:hypothetical protein
MPVCSVVSFSATVEILIRLYRRGGGERRLDTAQTIGPNCGVTHSPGKIEYNCRYFLMTFRKRIRKNKFSKNGFHNLQGTMSHRPLTNASSLKITAAYCIACQKVFLLSYLTAQEILCINQAVFLDLFNQYLCWCTL